jgi:hypothetical protein
MQRKPTHTTTAPQTSNESTPPAKNMKGMHANNMYTHTENTLRATAGVKLFRLPSRITHSQRNKQALIAFNKTTNLIGHETPGAGPVDRTMGLASGNPDPMRFPVESRSLELPQCEG